jgi:predicted permease
LTVLGVIFSFAFSGQLPLIMTSFLKTLGSAFSATALFLLGLRMVDKMDQFKGAKIIAPLILIALKLIAMPLIAREVVRYDL